MTIDEQIVNWFEYFHANPEISWEEHETTKKSRLY